MPCFPPSYLLLPDPRVPTGTLCRRLRQNEHEIFPEAPWEKRSLLSAPSTPNVCPRAATRQQSRRQRRGDVSAQKTHGPLLKSVVVSHVSKHSETRVFRKLRSGEKRRAGSWPRSHCGRRGTFRPAPQPRVSPPTVGLHAALRRYFPEGANPTNHPLTAGAAAGAGASEGHLSQLHAQGRRPDTWKPGSVMSSRHGNEHMPHVGALSPRDLLWHTPQHPTWSCPSIKKGLVKNKWRHT